MKLETFFGNFDLFADAPDAVAKLRELVLELAVQGRLSELHDDDEPVEVFLRRIWTDKSSNRNNLTEAEKAQPFDIPAHWRWVALAEVADFAIGKTPPRGDSRFWHPEDHSWVSIADMKHYQTITKTKEKVSTLAAQEVFRQRFAEPGSILMSFKLTIGKVARAGICCFHNEAIISLKPPELELVEYLYRFLPVFAALQTSNNAIKGSTLNKGLLTLLPVALPPLAEQKRIVAKVDEMMTLCDQLEAQQQERETRHTALARASLARFADAPTPANLEFLFHKSYTITPADLRKSIYQAAFDGVLTAHSRLAASPGTVPTGWVQREIASLCVIEDGDRGIAYPKKVDFSEAGHCVFLNTKNVRRHGFDFTNLEWISEEKHRQLRKGTLIRGDIVFTSRGTIGNIAHYDDAVPFDVLRINSGMFILRGFQKHMEASFLTRLLRSPQIRTQIDSLQSGSAQPQLPIREFRKFTATIPPLDEQRRIVAKVDQLMALVDQLETQITASEATSKRLIEAVVAELETAA